MKIDIDISTNDWILLFTFFVLSILFIWKFIFPLSKQFCKAKKEYKFADGEVFKTGGTFGEICTSYPFVTIKLGSSHLSIKFNSVEFNLAYAKINDISIYYGFTGNGVKIIQNDHLFDHMFSCSIFTIWTPFYKQLYEYLQYKVATSGVNLLTES